MRPLYLQACPGMRVEFEEPALKICQPDKARLLFPLSRVSRIVVYGFVQWQTEAMLACGRAGVSIVFLERNGDFIGRWQGKVSNHVPFLQNLGVLLEREQAAVCYQNWLLAMQRRAARSAARRLALCDWQTADLYALEQWRNRNLQPQWLAVLQQLKGIILSAVLAYLSGFGYRQKPLVVAGISHDLAEDLTHLLWLDFLPSVVKWQHFYEKRPESAVLFGLFEQRSQRLDHLLRSALHKLFLCLSE